MKTATCRICGRPDAPLDASGRIAPHGVDPIDNPCGGTGEFPQAPNGAEPDWKAAFHRLTELYNDDLTRFNANTGEIEDKREKIADLESRLAMAEDAAEKGNKARELAGAMEACIKEQDEKIAGLVKALADLFAMMDEKLLVRSIERDGEEGWAVQIVLFAIRLKAAKSALDAARDKKGTE